MRYTELLDSSDNMIFEGDRLTFTSSSGNHSEYRVKFGYYTAEYITVYGFYLVSTVYSTVHHMPEPDYLGRLKFFNETRGKK